MQKGSASRRVRRSRELRLVSGSAGSSAQVSSSDEICRGGKSPRLPRLSSQDKPSSWVFSRRSSRHSKMAQADGSRAKGATQRGEAFSPSPAPPVATEPLSWPRPPAPTPCSEPGGLLSRLGLCPPPGAGLQKELERASPARIAAADTPRGQGQKLSACPGSRTPSHGSTAGTYEVTEQPPARCWHAAPRAPPAPVTVPTPRAAKDEPGRWRPR